MRGVIEFTPNFLCRFKQNKPVYLYPFLDCNFVLTISIGDIAATANTAMEKGDIIFKNLTNVEN